MTVIYADILVTINLAVDYLLLFAAARIAGAEYRRLYGLLGAAVDALAVAEPVGCFNRAEVEL